MGHLISICIPAYKNARYLTRLLDSISMQTFRDFEVIVTDDSPDDMAEEACRAFEGKFPLTYYRNSKPLGSPANWNAAIARAKGEWIKIMHHDDWFARSESLMQFHKVTNKGSDFIFSAFTEVDELKKRHWVKKMSRSEEALIRKSPYNLFKTNYIGHPSTTLIRNNSNTWYDERISWVVDFEFYIRYLLRSPEFIYINEPLINIGIHETQVTKNAFRNPAVEIPENMYLLDKTGTGTLRNIYVYDYYWRLLRNLGIRNIAGLMAYMEEGRIPGPIKKMLRFQSAFPLPYLQCGIISKPLMLVHYLYNLVHPGKRE